MFTVTSEWAHLESNQGPTGYEPVALPAELWALFLSLQLFRFYRFPTTSSQDRPLHKPTRLIRRNFVYILVALCFVKGNITVALMSLSKAFVPFTSLQTISYQ